MNRVEELKRKYYPDDSKDGTLIFYNWIRQYTRSDFTVLNLGAGTTADRKTRSFKGEVKHVIGVDIDKAVLGNADLDHAVVIKDDTLPLAGNCIDLAWADYVMEHVQNPTRLLKEIHRVLKPGASFFFRTPNKYHYVSVIGWLTPHWFHALVANRARGLASDAHEPYPTFYRFNRKKDVTQNADRAGFAHVELRHIEAEPSYLVFHPLAFRIGVAYERWVNSHDSLSGLRANIFGRLEK